MVENAALRAIRLLDLVPYIVAHPGISITELAKEFSISRDEVLKDLNLLFLCGLPGYTPLELIDISFDEESVVIRDPQNLAAPRNLNESEALIARIALAALEESTPKTSAAYPQIIALREKIAKAFSSSIPISAITFTLDKERATLEAIESAITQELDLEMIYNNVTKDSSSRRSITPISIIAEDKRTLVSAYCHSAKALRTFNLSQISEISTKERSTRTDLERLEDSRGSSAEVIIKNEDSRFLSENASSLKELSKSCYQIDIFQPEWIVRSVLAGADSLELANPLELRAEIAERANRALLAYKG
ncbi:MAG: WYL domain-containing protein [Actinobacteria bacterium]|nr:WYL domain-containing protein [Actinomycetota bacterium]NBP22488.1 WYL domain-containing protein [Actinomycetota bacterium]NCU82687.1 WYL domain-containing protein [Actinomycetota bacterium]NDD07405.1 WYL domain-containing protein [Actinomycetota bacterium]NDF43328.1 WYL domain-containing protein [Actinomycetota bacterium]